MSELPTFEEAKICPRCGNPGEDRRTIPVTRFGVKPGTTVHQIICVTKGCRWYGTPWMVQVNPDGSIPPPHTPLSQDKEFPFRENITRTSIAKAQAALNRQLKLETDGGAEVTRRGSF